MAKETGVNAQKFHNWRRQFNRLLEKQFNMLNGVDTYKLDTAEARRLKHENSDLQKENLFLKKAARILRTKMSV